MGASVIAIATHFREEIRSGQVTIIATNKETIKPEDVLLEARKRLANPDRGNPIILDPTTIEFISRNHHLVDFQSRVYAARLPETICQRGIGQLNIVHESFGGLYHSSVHSASLRAVAASLKPGGILFTTETPNDEPVAYPNFTKTGLRPEKEYQWGIRGYRRYRKAE